MLNLPGVLSRGLSTAGRRVACHDHDAARRWATRAAMTFDPANAGFRIRAASNSRYCYAGGVCCTSRKHNTHITESREVLYRWHPWFGRVAWIFNVVEKNGEIILRCALEPLEERARISEMPQWMFDPVICRHIRYSVLPIVGCEALRELKRLLTDKSLAAKLDVVQAEHRPLSCTGGADATRSESPSGRSTRSVSALPRDARVGASAGGSAAADSAPAGATAAATPTRIARRGKRTGGVR